MDGRPLYVEIKRVSIDCSSLSQPPFMSIQQVCCRLDAVDSNECSSLPENRKHMETSLSLELVIMSKTSFTAGTRESYSTPNSRV